jgi:hypothetical protein
MQGLFSIEEDSTMTPAKTNEPVSFEANIKPLFRTKDRESMLRHFDLGSYKDVSAHADRILERLRSGTMPCDGEWPPAQIDVFERWIRTGKNP